MSKRKNDDLTDELVFILVTQMLAEKEYVTDREVLDDAVSEYEPAYMRPIYRVDVMHALHRLIDTGRVKHSFHGRLSLPKKEEVANE